MRVPDGGECPQPCSLESGLQKNEMSTTAPLPLGRRIGHSVDVRVRDGTTEPDPYFPEPTTITVSPATAELVALDATVQLSAEVKDQNGQVMAGATVTWASSATAVATVDASGLVTAVANGTATITATAGEASGSATVTVAQAVSSVTAVPAEANFAALGDTLRLTAEAFDANGHTVAGAEFSWETNDDCRGLWTRPGWRRL